MRINSSIINVLEKNRSRSKVTTQLLYGETFKIIKKKGNWLKIKNDTDNYIGYIKKRRFLSQKISTHKIFNLSANLYLKPSAKYKIKKKLSFGSRISVTEKKGKYYKFDKLWIKKKDVQKFNFKNKNIFSAVYKFKNIQYKWGGKHFSGIDCSGLIQLCLNYNNKFCPRDTKDQIKFFKKKIKLKNVKKNDLIFWKGHVAVCVSKKNLIHAYGPLKKVVVMTIKNTINRIYKTANLKVIGIRRIN